MTSELNENISIEQIPIIQITENGIVGFEILCRLCANRSDNLISVYSEEGISNDLSTKMNLYLPVKVSESDTLPLQCCFQCASTVLTWHELVVASVEADRRLRDLQKEAEKQLKNHNSQTTEKEVPQDSSTEECRIATNIPDYTSSDVQDETNKLKISLKKRGRPTKNKVPNPIKKIIKIEENPKIEIDNNPQAIINSPDGEWIKTEFIFSNQTQDFYDPQIVEPIEKNEFQSIKNTSEENEYEISDFETKHLVNENIDTNESHIKYFEITNQNIKSTKNCTVNDETLFKAESNDGEENSAENFEVDEKKSDKNYKREYHCDYCSTITKTNKELKQHIVEHHPNKLDQFVDIKRQKKRSKIDQETVNKAKVVVNSRTYYHCNECGKNLHSPYTYIWHNRIHTGERPFVCDLCGKQFRVSQGLVRHLRETHAGIKNFPCDLCGRMFASRRNVEEHRRIHTNERPYICDLCGKAFKQKASLFVHNRSHNDSFPFRCSYCNQGFRTRPSLLVHVTRHTGEKPFACDICGRCFRIKYELKRHQLIHSDDKPFSCTDCGQSFRQKRYLRNHNKINHNRATP